jgi:hypothetical protein
MEYTENDFNDPSIKNELKTINMCLKKINNYNNKYYEKSKIIDDKILSLSKTQYLDIVSSLELLKYQQKLINNERFYLTNLNKTFIDEFHTQIFNLSEKVTIMYMSLQNINKEINNDINKSIKCSSKKDNYAKIIDDILYNFENIKILLLKLKEYNISLNEELKNKNFHCRTLDHNIHKKRILIYINYKKFYETFETIIKYFYDHALQIDEKLDKDKHYNFLVNSEKMIISEDSNNKEDIFIKNIEKTLVDINSNNQNDDQNDIQNDSINNTTED